MSLDTNKKNITSKGDTLPSVRAELVCFPVIFDGQPYWVYKDPLSLRYYRFNREEHFVIEQLRRGVTLDELKEAHRKEFDSGDLSNEEIGQFVSSLTSRNLLVMSHSNRDEILYNAAKKYRRNKLLGKLVSILFIKIPLYDPDKLFDRLIKYLRFVWTGKFLLFYLILLAVAAGLVINRWSDIVSMTYTQFFTLYNIPILFLALWVVKALHEFGHGLACKNYGGEVHEMGLLFLVFMPMLYCNITDSWTFPSKAHRLLVTSGGILTELLLAALATVVWYYTEQPGFVHAFAYNVMIVCSISTVMFNAMPLMRFDGYYMMMDIVEIPNLRQRASMYMRNVFIRYILGGEPNEMPEEHRFKFVFPLYAISAFIYRWFIVFVIVISIYGILKQMHLKVFGQLFAIFSIATSLLLPLAKSGWQLTRQRHVLGISNTRLLTILAILVVAVSVVLFWPFRQHVTLNFVLEPTEIQWVRTGVDGRVHWTEQVQEGNWIEKTPGVVANLENEELTCELTKMQAQMEQVKIEIDKWSNRGDESQVAQLRERLKTLTNDEQRLREQVANLEVKVPFRGEILTPEQNILQLQDKYLARATPLLLVADTREFAAKVWVPEKTYARIFKQPDQRNQEATMMLYAFSKDKFTGKVKDVSLHREDNMGEFDEKLALSNKVGGEVLTEYDPVAEQEKPIETVYEVTIDIDKESLPEAASSFRSYLSGRVRIDCGHYTLYQWGKDSLLRFISPEVRL